MASRDIPIDHLRTWIGKQDRESDVITPELMKRFRATLGGYTKLALQFPLGIHWCLAQRAVTHDELGVDGHPAKGGFMPPVPLPRRMWASGNVRFHQKPDIGVPIERTSHITDVVLKQSAASGPLVFVELEHTYAQKNGQSTQTLIQEKQTIVYRQHTPFKEPTPQTAPTPARLQCVTPNSTLLSRYSGMTFNGHRIHYDHNYATGQEGYPGVVVQGPLMATLLMNLAQASRPNDPLQTFEFRGVAPAFVDQTLTLAVTDDKAQKLEIRNHQGALIMTASARFGEKEER